MKRKYESIIRRVLSCALVFSLTAAAVTGCGIKKGDDQDAQSAEPSASEQSLLPDDKSEEAGDTAVSDQAESTGAPITIIYHYLSCKDGDKELCSGKYPEFFFTDEFSERFPKLRNTLERFNESWKESAVNTTAEYGYYKQENDYGYDDPFAYELTLNIVRADDRLFTFTLANYEFSGGAHPSHYVEYYNFDPVTGNTVPLKDVITVEPGHEQSEMFWQRLYDTYPDNVQEFKDYDYGYDYETGEEIDTFAKKLEADEFSWAVLPDGLWIYFSPYEVLYYAAGYLEMNFSDADYPDLVQPAYKTTESFDEEKSVRFVDGETTDIVPQEPTYEGELYLSNPTWDTFYKTEYSKADPDYVTLEKTKEEKTDWIDLNDWCQTYNAEPKAFPYTIDEYTYDLSSPLEYSYMYSELLVSDSSSGDKLYDLNFYNLANGPDDETGMSSASTQYIMWAEIKDGILYVELSMNGYASEEPRSSYILGIDLETNDVIFRSEPQTGNAENFVIVDDTIICGYGFTAEPDFIYILDRFTGERIEKIPVNSAPEMFKREDDRLYVACYNTAYEFKINSK